MYIANECLCPIFESFKGACVAYKISFEGTLCEDSHNIVDLTILLVCKVMFH